MHNVAVAPPGVCWRLFERGAVFSLVIVLKTLMMKINTSQTDYLSALSRRILLYWNNVEQFVQSRLFSSLFSNVAVHIFVGLRDDVTEAFTFILLSFSDDCQRSLILSWGESEIVLESKTWTKCFHVLKLPAGRMDLLERRGRASEIHFTC